MYQITQIYSIWSKVIANLDVYDLIKLRRVCKKWKFIGEIDKLILTTKFFPYNSDWWFDEGPLLKKHCIRGKVPTFKIFESLKSLLIYDHRLEYEETPNSKTRIDLAILNYLKQLEHLEIINIRITNLKFTQLELPSLRRLRFEEVTPNFKDVVKFVLPKLYAIRLMSNGRLRVFFHFEQPETIKIVEIGNYFKFICEFKSLQYFYCEDLYGLSKNFLQNFNDLKAIVFIERYNYFEDLKRQKQAFNSDVILYFKGLELDLGDLDNKMNSLTDVSDVDWPFFASNYQYLTRIPFHVNLDLTRCFEAFDGKMPTNFVSKFCSIQTVRLNGMVANETIRELFQFFKECKFLRNLFIHRTRFRQDFFDNLPDAIPGLKHLDIELEPFIENVNFTARFKCLYVLLICFKPTLEEMELILPNLDLFHISSATVCFEIQKFYGHYDMDNILENREQRAHTYDDLIEQIRFMWPNL